MPAAAAASAAARPAATSGATSQARCCRLREAVYARRPHGDQASAVTGSLSPGSVASTRPLATSTTFARESARTQHRSLCRRLVSTPTLDAEVGGKEDICFQACLLQRQAQIAWQHFVHAATHTGVQRTSS